MQCGLSFTGRKRIEKHLRFFIKEHAIPWFVSPQVIHPFQHQAAWDLLRSWTSVERTPFCPLDAPAGSLSRALWLQLCLHIQLCIIHKEVAERWAELNESKEVQSKVSLGFLGPVWGPVTSPCGILPIWVMTINESTSLMDEGGTKPAGHPDPPGHSSLPPRRRELPASLTTNGKADSHSGARNSVMQELSELERQIQVIRQELQLAMSRKTELEEYQRTNRNLWALSGHAAPSHFLLAFPLSPWDTS